MILNNESTGETGEPFTRYSILGHAEREMILVDSPGAGLPTAEELRDQIFRMVHMATGVNLHTFNCHNHNPVIPLNAIQEFSIHFNEYVRQVGADQYLNNQLSSTTYVNPLLTIVHPPAGFQRPITRSDLDSIQDPEYNEIRDTSIFNPRATLPPDESRSPSPPENEFGSQAHDATASPKKQKKYPCLFAGCKKSYARSDHRIRHVKAKHLGRIEVWCRVKKCTSTKKMFTRKQYGLEHVIGHAVDNKCPICYKKPKSISLIKHLHTHRELFSAK